MFMFEKALVGSRRYWIWLGFLLVIICLGLFEYVRQEEIGLAITGLSRFVPWGLYIGQFAFAVGVGASAVVVVLPYYLHDWKAFHKVTLLGEILGMVAVLMAMLFIYVSMGQPMRVLNVLLHPHSNSLIFWDLCSLSGYLVLNAVIAVTILSAEHEESGPPKWIKPVIYVSIPWAISIHTVTAFLFAGLTGRSYFRTALLAPRFLTSAFSAGSALLVLLILLARRLRLFDPHPEAIPKLIKIFLYSMTINMFFLVVEAFTGFYSRIPSEMAHFDFLFIGLNGSRNFAHVMWASMFLAFASLILLSVPRWRRHPLMLPLACAFGFLSVWLDKGIAWIVSGFVPSPLGVITHYVPTFPEWMIVIGIWALGSFLLTVFYKIAFAVRAEKEPIGLMRYQTVGVPVGVGPQIHAFGAPDGSTGSQPKTTGTQ